MFLHANIFPSVQPLFTWPKRRSLIGSVFCIFSREEGVAVAFGFTARCTIRPERLTCFVLSARLHKITNNLALIDVAKRNKI